MRIDKNQRQAIVRAIVHDIPKPDRAKRHASVQAAVVKAMSPECRKVFNKVPEALAQEHIGDTTYDGVNWNTRGIRLGDCPKEVFNALLVPFKQEDAEYAAVERKLRCAVESCTTLKQLETMLPEFKKYFPTVQQPTKNLPAVANLVADLTKLGWPKSAQPATK